MRGDKRIEKVFEEIDTKRHEYMNKYRRRPEEITVNPKLLKAIKEKYESKFQTPVEKMFRPDRSWHDMKNPPLFGMYVNTDKSLEKDQFIIE